METREVFQFYNDTVKILYSEIEARNNTLPVELLFEIHSAFDHLKRYFIDGDRKTIINTARTARLEESKTNIDSAFENWCAVSKQIDDFESKYFDSAKIKWAEKQSFFHFNANFWLGVLAGVISSIAVALLFQLF